MASAENHEAQIEKTTAIDLPLRSRPVDGDAMAPAVQPAATPALVSPGIRVELYGDAQAKSKPAPVQPQSAPPDVQSFPSPMRHHRRTPSAHREIKETLNARSEYYNEDSEGRSHHQINQYIIKDEIGRGSYGSVHSAVDQFGNEYAIKAFSKARLRKRAQSNILRQGPRQPGRFHRAGFGAPDDPIMGYKAQRAKEAKDALYLIREEIAIMKKLNHPNLVQLIEVLDDPEDDSLYMVLEMCKKGVVMHVGLGESATPYDEEQCRYWFRDLILGIEYLHSQGVVHRDIKPDNLLLTEDDVLKIVDFGVSEMFEKPDNMRTAKSAGSPAFLPPELCVAKHGDVSGKAADIWSMGVSLYCLRYGRIPFEREGVLDIYEAIRTETPKLPPDENPDFVDLMGRVLEKDPEKRITMAELREHPWVTKGGTDPLLSAEENCSEPVDPPNLLEVNHAFTRRMSHLICVMKAIRKFKSLLSRRRAARRQDAHQDLGSNAGSSSPRPDEKAHDPQSTAEFAARVLRERQEFLAKGGRASLDQLLRQSSSSSSTLIATRTSESETQDSQGQPPSPPPFLGIGTGGIDAFPSAIDDPRHPLAVGNGEGAPVEAVVSDSPTVVDFNVYDRAFEAEVERIKRSSSRRTGAGARGSRGQGRPTGSAGAAGQPAVIYQTRLSERRGGGDAGLEGGQERLLLQLRGGSRFADLVARAMAAEGAKERLEKSEGSAEGQPHAGGEVNPQGLEGQ
ncbi:kinase-like domain-containing protein [Thermothelomyces heterothallicus CBS 202.75]|uniref:kinase-like domain-containing protein n=1 Tax=Thermothelomyces heterothallicus CBS 202.75 TaxID=1149848 RepID=UPI003742C56A